MSHLERQRAIKLEEIRIQGAAKGWILVTKIYGGSKTKVEFMCEKGHLFSLTANHINRNKCSVCSGLSPIAAATKFYNIIAEKGGYVTPNAYITSHDRVELTCEYGHKWNTTPAMINHGSWCPECANLSPEAAARKFYEIIAKRGAIPLDPYINSKTRVRIKCEQGHLWITRPDNINSDIHWCPICMNRSPQLAAETYYKAVQERGGIPIDKYINSETKLQIQCGKKHLFSMRPDHVKSGRWCRICNESKGELVIANILTELRIPFQRQTHLPELNRCAYDFLIYYNGKHIFIEFDGKQHFKQASYHTLEEFQAGRKRDIEKTKLVIEKYKLRMIRISYRVYENGSDLKASLTQALDLSDPLVYIDHELYSWLTPEIKF